MNQPLPHPLREMLQDENEKKFSLDALRGYITQALGDAWADGFNYAASADEPVLADNPWLGPCQAPSCDDAAELGRKVCRHHRKMFTELLETPS